VIITIGSSSSAKSSRSLSVTKTQADDYAASVVGADEMRRALEKLAEINMMKLRTGRFWNIMSQHPGMEQRIQRLQEQARSEQPSWV
jgi:Zn-dependent protease with chaperone function